jgi:hypothetical protein
MSVSDHLDDRDQERLPARHTVPLSSFVTSESIGLGTALKRITTAVGVPPYGGCSERAAALDRFFAFSPSQPATIVNHRHPRTQSHLEPSVTTQMPSPAPVPRHLLSLSAYPSAFWRNGGLQISLQGLARRPLQGRSVPLAVRMVDRPREVWSGIRPCDRYAAHDIKRLKDGCIAADGTGRLELLIPLPAFLKARVTRRRCLDKRSCPEDRRNRNCNRIGPFSTRHGVEGSVTSPLPGGSDCIPNVKGAADARPRYSQAPTRQHDLRE